MCFDAVKKLLVYWALHISLKSVIPTLIIAGQQYSILRTESWLFVGDLIHSYPHPSLYMTIVFYSGDRVVVVCGRSNPQLYPHPSLYMTDLAVYQQWIYIRIMAIMSCSKITWPYNMNGLQIQQLFKINYKTVSIKHNTYMNYVQCMNQIVPEEVLFPNCSVNAIHTSTWWISAVDLRSGSW